MPGTSPVNPNRKLNSLINQESNKKEQQMISQLSVSDLLDEQILEQTMAELLKNPRQFSSEQIQEIFRLLPLKVEQIKLIIIHLKHHKIIDSGLAGLLCASFNEFNIAIKQNCISEKKKENLNNIINLAKSKFENLIFNNQLEAQAIKLLILMLSFVGLYVETINII